MLDGTEYFECQCHFDEHTINFTYNKGNKEDIHDPPEIYLSVFLSDANGFFKRIWLAIRYILGYKTRYGHFGNWIMKDEDIDRMISFCQCFKKDTKEWKKYQKVISS